MDNQNSDLVTSSTEVLPGSAGEEDWRATGMGLGAELRMLTANARGLAWRIGEWWNEGERYGNRVAVVTAPGWTGPAYATCRQYGSVAARMPLSSRYTNLSFEHHAALMSLPDEDRAITLAEADKQLQETGQAPKARDLRQRAKERRREIREQELGESTRQASAKLGKKLYGVIYCDPPWRFEPRSRTSGMDRAADNHYPTMDKAELEAIKLPAASNCVLFLWATAPMLEHALDLMRHWGFAYKSHAVWAKRSAGTGYWFRSRHELLLVGTKGKPPAPAQGQQMDSVFTQAVGAHSAKPAAFREMIAKLYPNTPRLEMFARQPAAGWDSHGNQVEGNDENSGD